MATKSMFADAVGNHYNARLGTVVAVASGDANARPTDCSWVAPANGKLVGVWKHGLQANEVTKGTATTSASFRRHTINNGGSAGTATTILASLNATSSQASLGSRGYALAATPTFSQGDILYASHLTVGAATADGTDAAACIVEFEYQLT